jgi:hypothetical protein
MKLGIYEILHAVNTKKTKGERLEELKKHSSNEVLKTLLKMSFDPGLKWRLPEGTPPYTPSPDMDQQGMLYSEFRRFYIWVEVDERGANINPTRREQLWIDLLEHLHPQDAKVVSHVKDKDIPKLYPHVTRKLVVEAWPELLK